MDSLGEHAGPTEDINDEVVWDLVVCGCGNLIGRMRNNPQNGDQKSVLLVGGFMIVAQKYTEEK